MDFQKIEYDIHNTQHVELLRNYGLEKDKAGGWWEFLASKGLYNMSRQAVNFQRIKEVNFFEGMDRGLSRLIASDINKCKQEGRDWLSPETRANFEKLRVKMAIIGKNRKSANVTM
jgi:hypothetical protein